VGLWAGVEILGVSDLGFGRWSYLPNGAYTLLLLVLPGLAWAYRKQSPATVGLYALVLGWWVILQLFAWHLEANPAFFIGAVGGLFLIIAESHAPGNPLAIPFRALGVILVGGTLVPLSFYGFNRWEIGSSSLGGLGQTAVILGLALVVLVIAACVKGREGDWSGTVLDKVRDLVRCQWLPVGLVALMALLALNASLTQGTQIGALVPTVLANLAMVSLSLWLIRIGLRQDRSQPFSAGVLYFLLWAIMRYVDLFSDMAGMLGAALMFFLCGTTLLLVAFYWRHRKEVRRV
jgi:hypothetical protein